MSTVKVNTVDKRTGGTLTLGGCGTTVTLGAGATQSGFGRTGTVDWCTTAKTAPFTGVSAAMDILLILHAVRLQLHYLLVLVLGILYLLLIMLLLFKQTILQFVETHLKLMEDVLMQLYLLKVNLLHLFMLTVQEVGKILWTLLLILQDYLTLL
jgi:hypothetical protein